MSIQNEPVQGADVSVQQNLIQIRSKIADACDHAGRDPATVKLIAVTKTVDRDLVDAAYAAGVRDFGENRIQDAKSKFAEGMPDDAKLHLIGHLQTNKARDAARLFNTVQTVDRSSLIDALQRRAKIESRVIDVLVQVNVAREEQKHGCDPTNLPELLESVAEQSNLRARGLMTIAPLVEAAEETRPVFCGLRELRDAMGERYPELDLTELSMGMTNDFAVAIEEGSTMVRLGRAVFSG